MIYDITSDLPSFKRLQFRRGLNILLADKSVGATDRQSRNGAGKTSLVELIHFIFGSNADKESIFRSEALLPWTFDLTADIGGGKVTASRSGTKPSKIKIDGRTENWPFQPEVDRKTGEAILSNENWRLLLGAVFFGLPIEEIETRRFAPTFRSLFSYFARRQNSGGFVSPTQQSNMQQPWDQQVAVSYLLGLDAAIPGEFQEVRAQERAMAELRKAAKGGDLGRFFGTAADLRTSLTIAEARTKRLRDRLTNFNVVPEYVELEREASTLTQLISSLNDESVIDRELIQQLEGALASEKPPAVDSLLRLYQEAGVLLSEAVRRRFDEVQKFHLTIIENRKAHLSSEIAAANQRLDQRAERRDRFDTRRRQLMEILRSGGALDHYASLQEEAGRSEADTETLRQRLATAEKIESTKVELDIERARLLKDLQGDLTERRGFVEEAILVFEELSNALYEKAGNLTISATPGGLDVAVKIDSQRSKGITNMQIFCFDLMLADLLAKRGIGPGFLVHDSHLFDGVDERQVAKALQLGADHAEAIGYQYIVTLNSDALPKDGFRPGFDVRQYVLPTKLTDASDSGGLFGLRFN